MIRVCLKLDKTSSVPLASQIAIGHLTPRRTGSSDGLGMFASTSFSFAMRVLGSTDPRSISQNSTTQSLIQILINSIDEDKYTSFGVCHDEIISRR